MARQTVLAFWQAMGTNDFAHASTFLHSDFEYYMPQTNEYLRGRDAFAALNTAYPAEGRWSFTVNSILCEGSQAVSDVGISDGTMTARAISFHWIKDKLILRQKEFWPDDYPAPEWRKDHVSVLDTPPF